jgi:hypothetical protein
VRVVEPGDERQPAQVNDVPRGPLRPAVVDPDDPPAGHRDRAGPCLPGSMVSTLALTSSRSGS